MQLRVQDFGLMRQLFMKCNNESKTQKILDSNIAVTDKNVLPSFYGKGKPLF